MVAPRPSFTLGIEEEFQIIDPETRALKSHIQELFAEGELRLKDKIKREIHQSVIEVGTGICREHRRGARGGHDASKREIVKLTARERPRDRGGRHASVHPLVGSARSRRTRGTSRSSTTCRWSRAANLIFGLHVHVAVEDDETRIALHERGALLPAARLRALHELAVLVRPRHRLEELPREGLRPVPAHGHPGPVLLLGRLT